MAVQPLGAVDAHDQRDGREATWQSLGSEGYRTPHCCLCLAHGIVGSVARHDYSKAQKACPERDAGNSAPPWLGVRMSDIISPDRSRVRLLLIRRSEERRSLTCRCGTCQLQRPGDPRLHTRSIELPRLVVRVTGHTHLNAAVEGE